MLMIAPDSSTCRTCGVPIEKGEHISWANGPYHLACTPIPQDWDEAKAANFLRDTPKARPNVSRKGEFSIVLLVTVASIATLLWAMVPGSPYGYFIFLRWVVCAASIVFLISPAQLNLGIMYGQGQGVARDYVEALKWLNLAVAGGLAAARKPRGILERRMTREQIADAQRRADESLKATSLK